MPCYRPQPAYLPGPLNPSLNKSPRIIYPTSRDATGAREFSYTFNREINSYITVPCNKCFGCRLQNAREWSLRMMHEARYSDRAYFVTLTYAPEHLPANGDLDYSHLDKFFKDAWHVFRGQNKFRYFACGEYGDKTLRPHYHFAGFDFQFDDLRYLPNKKNAEYYVSEKLRDLWGRGHVVVAPLTWFSAAYIARYVTKKMHGQNVREYADADTGEVFKYTIQRAFQSKGIGLRWLNDNWKEVWDLDGCLYKNDYIMKPPRYYFKQLEKRDLPRSIAIKEARRAAADERNLCPIDAQRDRELIYAMEAHRLQMQTVLKEIEL